MAPKKTFKRRKTIRRKRPNAPRRTALKSNFGRLTKGVQNTGFPQRYVTKLTTQYVWNPAADTGTLVYSINANNLYNPSSSGHQPRDFDQFAAIYARYRVYGCKVQTTTVGSNSSTMVLGMVSLTATPSNSTAPNTTTGLMESRMTKYKMFSADDKKVRLDAYWPIWKIEGMPKSHVAVDDLFSSLVSTGPSVTPSIQVAISSADGTSTDALVVIKTTYYCVFSGRKFLAQS